MAASTVRSIISRLKIRSFGGRGFRRNTSPALKLIGLSWKAAAGMGIGLAQLGEFSFLLIAEGVGQGIISPADYNRLLFIALGTLILTPQLIKFGLRWTSADDLGGHERDDHSLRAAEPVQKGLVIGIGPIGRQIASRLETLGVDVAWSISARSTCIRSLSKAFTPLPAMPVSRKCSAGPTPWPAA
jgi:hypothetical protein